MGGHIVENLLHSGCRVLVLDNKYPPNEVLVQIEQADNSLFILCDITRYNDVYRAFKTFEKEAMAEQRQRSNSVNSISSTGSLDSNISGNNVSEDKSRDRILDKPLNEFEIECVFHCAALTDQWAPR